jgi:hypothetical protein
MFDKDLNEVKTKRLKAIFCWIDYGHYNDKFITDNGQTLRFFTELGDKTKRLITLRYQKSGNPSLTFALIRILSMKTYSEDIVPFLEYLDAEYKKFNDLNFEREYIDADDFWINSESEHKWRIWKDSYLTDY